MLVKVLIPFTDKVTGKLHKADDEITLTAERLAEIRAVNVNMVSVLDKPTEPEEPKKPNTRKKKAE